MKQLIITLAFAGALAGALSFVLLKNRNQETDMDMTEEMLMD